MISGRHCKALVLYPTLFLCLGLAAGAPARAGIHPLWDKYLTIYEGNLAPEVPAAKERLPGRILGDWTSEPLEPFLDSWPHRTGTYEILSATNQELARLIYSLALFTHDLDPSVDLARFERGAQGFHYSVDQVADWANAVLAGEITLATSQELSFLGWLTEDGVLVLRDGAVAPGDTATHVLGAAPGKTRGMEANLRHERLHVMWDEDPSFRDEYTARWATLSAADQEAVLEDLSGYDRDNIPGIIEEWAVRTRETQSGW